MTETDQQESRRDIALYIRCVVATGLLITAAAQAFAGVSAAIGTAIGCALAASNLWFFAKMGERLLSGQPGGAPWAIAGVLKFVLLAGIFYALLHAKVVTPFPLIAGYTCLPLGLCVGALWRATRLPVTTDDVTQKRPPPTVK